MKTLIVYATKYGSAKKCAVMIQEKLKGEVQVADLKNEKNLNINVFDQIIIGGSIYAGTIQKEVTEFCTQNLEALKHKRIGLFITCMNDAAGEMQLSKVFPEALIKTATAKSVCGGEYYFNKMNFVEKMLIKMINKSEIKKNPATPLINTRTNLSALNVERINKFCEAVNCL